MQDGMGTHWPLTRAQEHDNLPPREGTEYLDGESEEEQSGLSTLLLQVPLAELREIARQRGWRVKGTSKAEYVSALASLLCDPTETARAVTGLPEHLREGLRAAFVADDGSGITATTMAQTMTALRGPAGATVAQEGVRSAYKPVEAAALLSDLARWGLVLQWHDSIYGEGRHVLPWQVQRLVPPLPGWCPPDPAVATASGHLSGEAAETPQSTDPEKGVRSTYPQQAVHLLPAKGVTEYLCAVWKSVDAQQPALHPATGTPSQQSGAPVERMAERRFSSIVQGWPYDSDELREWASSRRGAEAAMQMLSVPATPFLIEDAAVPTLARLSEGDARYPSAGPGKEEHLEFLCRVLCEMDLIGIRDGHLVAQHESTASFLELAVPDRQRAMAQAYLSLLDWSELDLLLRQNTRLMLWRKPYYAIPYEQFRSMLVRLRHLLLRFLACAGEDNWCSLTDVEGALREIWPHFAAPLQDERQSWFSEAWGLAWHQENGEPTPSDEVAVTRAPSVPDPAEWAGRHLSGEARQPAAGYGSDERTTLPPQPPKRRHGVHEKGEVADWRAGQGAFLRVMLEGPLYWLGFAELTYSNGQLVAFRLHGLSDWMWDRPTAHFDQAQPAGEVLTVDETAGTISMPPGSVAPQAHTFLRRIARLEEANPERFLYRLHPQAALAAFESGSSLSDLLAEWEQVMSRPIPASLSEILGQFWARYGQVRLYQGFSLLEVNDEVTLQELEASTSLTRHIAARVSPRLVLVPDDLVDALMRELADKGYTPKEVY